MYNIEFAPLFTLGRIRKHLRRDGKRFTINILVHLAMKEMDVLWE